MKLKILSFDGASFSNEHVVSVTLMTQMGEITVLDNHSPLITAIKPSTMFLVYRDENGMDIRDDYALGRGVVEVSHNEVKVMSDMLVDIADLDVQSAERAREEALALMERYKNASDRIDMEKFIEAEDMLLRSIAQLKLYDMKK